MQPTRQRNLVTGAWIVGTAIALVVTLASLSRDDFDGLNNLWQIPFALPWFLLPAFGSNAVQAWIAAAMGLLNALLIYRWLSRQSGSLVNDA